MIPSPPLENRPVAMGPALLRTGCASLPLRPFQAGGPIATVLKSAMYGCR